jgi:nicotinamidase-related amidase
MEPRPNNDLHGNAPDESAAALLIIDMINDLEFVDGEALLPPALVAARNIVQLKRRARASSIPVIYANDNFGRWRSDFRGVVRHCLEDGTRGEPLVRLLEPDEDDYFVLKPKHSAFFATTLDTLLKYLGAHRLILTGITSDICVMLTANDAYMRDLVTYVPRDCVAAVTAEENEHALRYMERVLKTDTTPSTTLDLESLISSQRPSNRVTAAPDEA